MVIDCHFHLDPRCLDIAGLLKKMDHAGVDQTCLMGAMVDPFPEPNLLTVKALHFLLGNSLLRKFIPHFLANFDEQNRIKMPTGKYQMYDDVDNAPVFAACEKYPERFKGWVFLNPRGNKDPLEELGKWEKHPAFIGVKAHPFWQRFPVQELLPVAQRLKQLHKPILLHLGFKEQGDISSLLTSCPGLKIIIAHAGFPLFEETWKQFKEQPNVYIDLSQTSYVSEKMTQKAVNFLGPERCLFGTDGPFGRLGADKKIDYGLLKRRVLSLFPDPSIQSMILGSNLQKLIQ